MEKRRKTAKTPVIEHVIVIDVETTGDFVVGFEGFKRYKPLLDLEGLEVTQPPKPRSIKPCSLIAVGGSVVHVPTGKEVSSIRVCLEEEPGHEFEPRCWREFWDLADDKGEKPMHALLDIFRAEALPPKKAMKKLAAWLDEQEATRPHSSLWSDNPTFDYGIWLTTYMQKYLGRRSMLFKNGKTYRRINCTTDYARGIMCATGEPSAEVWQKLREIGVELPVDASEHDHMPDHDARYIAKQAAALLRWAAEHKFTEGALVGF